MYERIHSFPSLNTASLWVSRTGSASDWCALQEALYKCIDTIQYTIQCINALLNREYSHAYINTYTPALKGTSTMYRVANKEGQTEP